MSIGFDIDSYKSAFGGAGFAHQRAHRGVWQPMGAPTDSALARHHPHRRCGAGLDCCANDRQRSPAGSLV